MPNGFHHQAPTVTPNSSAKNPQGDGHAGAAEADALNKLGQLMNLMQIYVDLIEFFI